MPELVVPLVVVAQLAVARRLKLLALACKRPPPAPASLRPALVRHIQFAAFNARPRAAPAPMGSGGGAAP